MKAIAWIKSQWLLLVERRAFSQQGGSSLTSGRRSGLVLSLTSIKPRLPTLHLTLHRALRSGFQPEFVEIWLDHTLGENITPELKMLERRGCRINLIEDVGPQTKLVYALARHPDKKIITIDDDIWLPHGACEALLQGTNKHPPAVVCNRARVMALDSEGRPMGYSAWRSFKEPSLLPAMDLMPLGYGGVLYPPDSLDERVADVATFKRLCPTGDDLWFTAMRLLRGRPVFHTAFFKGRELLVPKTEPHSIKKRHGTRGNNDSAIQALFAEFKLDKALQNKAR